MAEGFGGRYSPPPGRPPADPAGKPEGPWPAPRRNPFRGRGVERARARVNLLFLAPLPLLLTAFGNGPVGLAVSLAAFGALVLAAWLLREGLRAEDAYTERRAARRPAFPRKIFASALTGLGVALAVWRGEGAVFGPALYGLIAAGLHSVAFGIDPLRNKGMDGFDDFANSRVTRAVEEAEKHLAAMSEAIARVRDRRLEAHVERFQAAAREMFRTIEADPRDLTAARRYLGVYLVGARDATVKFADLYTRAPTDRDRADYEALLTDLEANFQAQTRVLMLDDRSDMAVEIEVLRERLAREGVRPEEEQQDR
jgi:hypothetical protein